MFTKFIKAGGKKTIRLQADRGIYLAGEKIWFKAYLTDVADGRPDKTTRNLFADIVTEQDSIVDRLVLDNLHSRTAGVFRLSPELKTGFYTIRCYTAAQLNDPASMFLSRIFIINERKKQDDLHSYGSTEKFQQANTDKLGIRFTPERLTGIADIISTGVLEIRDEANRPLSVVGVLINSNDSIIAQFKTNDFGLARLTFVHAASEEYAVLVNWKSQPVRFRLPAVDKNAIQLSLIRPSPETIKVFVTQEESVPANTRTTILVMQKDSLYFAAVGTGNYGITIPTGNLPGGVVRLLLFDERREIIRERRIYVARENVHVELGVGKKYNGTHEKVMVHVKITGTNGHPLPCALTASVQDERVTQFADSLFGNSFQMFNPGLAEQWLKRFYEKYGNENTDMLMITQQEPVQKSGSNTNQETAEYEDSGLLLNFTGKIINSKGLPSKDRIITAIAKSSTGFFMDVDTTDAKGLFSLPTPQEYDSLEFSVQITDKQYKPEPADSIVIDRFLFPDISTPAGFKQSLPMDEHSALIEWKKSHADRALAVPGEVELAPVILKSTLKKATNYDVSKRINSMSQILTSDKFRYGGYQAIGNAILMVPGVTLSFGDISIFGPNANIQGTKITRPMIIMDGYEVSGIGNVMDFLNDLHPADIDFIEVLRGGEAGIYGVRGGSGVISINSRQGSEQDGNIKSSRRNFIPLTYHVCPRFNIPDYADNRDKVISHTEEYNTLYWNNNIVTGDDGEAVLEFLIGERAANYVITVTGITRDGDWIEKREVFHHSTKP